MVLRDFSVALRCQRVIGFLKSNHEKEEDLVGPADRVTGIDKFLVATGLPGFRGVDYVAHRQGRRCLPEWRGHVPVARIDSPMICIIVIPIRHNF